MKKRTVFLVLLLCGLVLSTHAQSSNTKRESLGKKVGKFLKDTKKELEKAGHELGDAIGFEDRRGSSNGEYALINGNYYMYLYNTNLYTGDSAQAFRQTCTVIFQKKYPNVTIQSVVIPQKEWQVSEVEANQQIEGFMRTLHCYIVAKDGNEAYINAKFTFAEYKKVGHSFEKVQDSWPKVERIDVLTPSVYNQLLIK